MKLILTIWLLSFRVCLTGFWLPVAADAFALIAFILVVVVIRNKIKKSVATQELNLGLGK